MKKIVLSALVAAFSLCANAQSQYEAKEGDMVVEVSFNPFSNSFNTVSLKGGQMSGKYFISDKNAVRLNLGFGYDGTSDKVGDNEVSKHSGAFSLGLGIENHFASAGRLDLYAGGQLGLSSSFGGAKVGNKELSGGTIASGGWNIAENNVDACSTTISLKAFTGINFFVYKSLYVGAEFGVSFASTSYKDFEIKEGDTTIKRENNQSRTSFGLYAEPALHLGWAF